MWKSVGLTKLTPPFTDCGIDGPGPQWTLLDSVAEELTQALRGELPPNPHTMNLEKMAPPLTMGIQLTRVAHR